MKQVIADNWRLIHDVALTMTWVLSYWVTSRIVDLKELDPRPYEGVKFFGPFGVLFAVFAKPFGLRKDDATDDANLVVLVGAMVVAFLLVVFVVFGFSA